LKKNILLLGKTGYNFDYFVGLNHPYLTTDINSNYSAVIAFSRFDIEKYIKNSEIDFSKLDWIHLPGAGIEKYIDFIDRYPNILFTNGKIIQGPQVAEHAIALLLSLTRKIHMISKFGQGVKFDFRPFELNDKKVLIVGFGGIGKAISSRLSGFGCTIEVVNFKQNFGVTDFNVNKHYYFKDIDLAVSGADIIISAIPETKLTRKLFDKNLFSKFKQDSIFINVTRGPIVCTDDLLDSLSSKKLLAAGLDVTDPEPLPDNHPLFNLNNVIITPHIAGISDKTFNERSINLISNNINRYINDEDLINLVNRKNYY